MKRFHPLAIREAVRANPDRSLVASAAILLTLQILFPEDVYHKISIAMIFLVFASKSWFNFVFAITTQRQQGETLLSIRIERYFWALFGQAVAFSALFLFAFVDVMGFSPHWMNLVAFRNVLRSIAIVAVLDVIIRGDLTVAALMDYIRRENRAGHEIS